MLHSIAQIWAEQRFAGLLSRYSQKEPLIPFGFIFGIVYPTAEILGYTRLASTRRILAPRIGRSVTHGKSSDNRRPNSQAGS